MFRRIVHLTDTYKGLWGKTITKLFSIAVLKFQNSKKKTKR